MQRVSRRPMSPSVPGRLFTNTRLTFGNLEPPTDSFPDALRRYRLGPAQPSPEYSHVGRTMVFGSISTLASSTAAAATTAARPRSADGCLASGQTHAATPHVSAPEHGRIPEHVGDDKEADVGSSDVHLVEVADSAVARGDCDVFELDVHVVFGCEAVSNEATNISSRNVGRERGTVANLLVVSPGTSAQT